MDTKKKAQIMMLVLAILVLAAVGTAGYALTGRRGLDRNREEEQRITRQESAREAGEPKQQAEEQAGQGTEERGKEINDGFVYLEGGSFSMGSPEGGAPAGTG